MLRPYWGEEICFAKNDSVGDFVAICVALRYCEGCG